MRLSGVHMAGLAALALAATPRIEEGIRRVYDDEPKKPKADSTPEPVKPERCLVEVQDEDIPRQLSVRYASEHFHGGVSKMIGLIVDGQPRNDVRDYDLDQGRIRGKGDWEYPELIEVFWLQAPSRQVRRSLRRGR